MLSRLTNKVTSRTGRCHGRLRTDVLAAVTMGCCQGQGQHGGGTSSALRGQLWSCDSLEVLALELWEEWAALNELGSAWPPSLLWGWHSATSPSQGASVGTAPQRHEAVTSVSVLLPPPPLLPALNLLWPFYPALASSSKKEKS